MRSGMRAARWGAIGGRLPRAQRLLGRGYRILMRMRVASGEGAGLSNTPDSAQATPKSRWLRRRGRSRAVQLALSSRDG
jgi:hypothetical protein